MSKRKYGVDRTLVEDCNSSLQQALGQLKENAEYWPAALNALEAYATLLIHDPSNPPELSPGDCLRLAANIRRSKDLRDVWAGAAQIPVRACPHEARWELQSVEGAYIALWAAQWIGRGLPLDDDARAPLDEGELLELQELADQIRDAAAALPPRMRRQGRSMRVWADPEMWDALPW